MQGRITASSARVAPAEALSTLKNPVKLGLKTGIKSLRGWRWEESAEGHRLLDRQGRMAAWKGDGCDSWPPVTLMESNRQSQFRPSNPIFISTWIIRAFAGDCHDDKPYWYYTESRIFFCSSNGIVVHFHAF